MIEVLVGLPVIALVALLLGGGWAALLRRAAPAGWIGFIFLSWSSAIVLTSAAWSWVYPSGHGVRFALALTLAAALAGYALAWWRHSFPPLRGSARSLTGLAAGSVVVLVALVPAYSSWTHVSTAVRIGPDGAGYAISARSIGQGTTRPALERELIAQEGVTTIGAAMAPGTLGVDTTLSTSVQGASEFVLGADRWGFPGVVGSVIYLVGPGQLWTALTLLAAFGLLTACIGVWSIVTGTTGSTWAALVAVILLGLSPALLDAWHEGALAQAWILPACVLLARPLAALGEEDRVGGAVSLALGVALILVAFNDAMLIYVVVFGLCMLFSIPLLRRRWWPTWWPLVAGAAVGGLLVTPSTAVFLTTLSRSLGENSGAGWPQPRWLDLAEAFGLHNAFVNGVPSVGTRSAGENVTQVAEGGLVVTLLAAVLWRRLREPAVVLLTSVVVAATAVYVKTRYLDHVTNYQYFKAVALLIPAGAVAVGVLIGRAAAARGSEETRSRARHSRRENRSTVQRSVVLGLSGVVAAAVVVAGISYVSAYRAQGTTVPSAFDRLATSSDAAAVFERFNIVAATGAVPPRTAIARILGFDLAAEVNLNWIGRYDGTPPTRLDGRERNPVGLLVFEEDCPQFACLDGIPRSRVPFRSDGIAVVDLDRATSDLATLPETEWATWAATRFRALGGGQLVGFVPGA